MKLQHQKFADAYLRLNSGTKAAIEAGYSVKTARVKASQLLCIEEIETYIEQQRVKLSEDAIVDAKWVQERFKEVSDKCMQVEPVMIKIDGVLVESGEYKFDSMGVIGATRELGKIIGVYEKDNDQSKSETTNIINLGGGIDPNAATS